MAAGIVSGQAGITAAESNSVTVTLGSAGTEGNVLFAFALRSDNAPTPGLAASGFTELDSRDIGWVQTLPELAIFAMEITASLEKAITVTATGTAYNTSVWLCELENVDLGGGIGSIIRGTDYYTSDTSSVTTTPLTTGISSYTGDIGLACSAVDDSGHTWTYDNSYVEQHTSSLTPGNGGDHAFSTAAKVITVGTASEVVTATFDVSAEITAGFLVTVKGVGATAPVPIPSITASGAAVANASGSTAIAIPYPAGLTSGDLLLIDFTSRTTELPSTPSGWTLEADSGATVPRTVWFSLIAASESGTLDVGANISTADAKIGRMHRSSTADTVEASATNTGTSKTPGHPDLTTLTAASLVLMAEGIDDNETAVSFTSETGGDFTLLHGDRTALGNDLELSLQTAEMASTGTLSGGTWTYGGATENWSHAGIAIYLAAGDATLVMGSGAFAYAGTALTLKADHELVLGSGAFGYSGTAVTLQSDHPIGIGSGAFGYSGTALTLKADHELVLGSGAFGYSGTAVGLVADHQIVLGSGAFGYSGTAVTLKADHELVLGSGAFGFAGTAVTLQSDHPLGIGSGAFGYSGTALTLKSDHELVLGSGAFGYAGTDVTLTFAGAAVLVMGSGAFAFTGTALDFKHNDLVLGSGAFGYSGTSLTLKADHGLVLGSGAFGYSGTAVTLKADRQLVLGSGAFGYTGTAVTLTYTPVAGAETLVMGSGAFAYSGATLTLKADRQLVMGSGAFAYAGTALTLTYLVPSGGDGLQIARRRRRKTPLRRTRNIQMRTPRRPRR